MKVVVIARRQDSRQPSRPRCACGGSGLQSFSRKSIIDRVQILYYEDVGQIKFGDLFPRRAQRRQARAHSSTPSGPSLAPTAGKRSCKSGEESFGSKRGGAWTTPRAAALRLDRKSTRLNSSHLGISYA